MFITIYFKDKKKNYIIKRVNNSVKIDLYCKTQKLLIIAG